MDEIAQPVTELPRRLQRWRNRFAASLGVRLERRKEIYLDISRAATLFDTTYWLQILFAAGVATLGLVLNSPAVIIGAMLISPLMGPILAAGLSLATGDLVLGIRAGANLLLSCLLAILFSVMLVGLLPFKELTAEIAARTQPNTLDLVVALFSGAIGSIATCKEAKGVVTSIPGVAIAVALMPPLCVVGYGIGLAGTLDWGEGMRVARGGGLLFLTNLVAITFTAMLVFLALHIDTSQVRERVREWRRTDRESAWVRDLLGHYQVTDKLGAIGGLRGRLMVILLPLLLILIPLSISLSQLKREITKQQAENRVRRAATEIWQQHFTRSPSGETRSFLDQLIFSEREGKLLLTLRIFDNQPYIEADRIQYARLVATRLNRPADSVQVQLIEIPTAAATASLAARAREEKRIEPPPTVAQLRARFWSGVEAAMTGLRLPPAARLLDYRMVTGDPSPSRIIIGYLADSDITPDAQALIAADARARLSDESLDVAFERLPPAFGPLAFRRNDASLSPASRNLLAQAAQMLQTHPACRVEIVAQREANEPEDLAQVRAAAVIEYFVTRAGFARERFSVAADDAAGRGALLRLVGAGKTQQ
ncbi:MAG: DUF389 domain-containing protein [Blastocatellia bacterium]